MRYGWRWSWSNWTVGVWWLNTSWGIDLGPLEGMWRR